jgi:hypothetical protein
VNDCTHKRGRPQTLEEIDAMVEQTPSFRTNTPPRERSPEERLSGLLERLEMRDYAHSLRHVEKPKGLDRRVEELEDRVGRLETYLLEVVSLLVAQRDRLQT